MPRRQQTDTTLYQVFSLYFLLFAFFVILFNISRPEDARSRAVADSLNATFANEAETGQRKNPLISAEGDVVASANLEQTIGDLVKTEIPLARVIKIHPGRLLEVLIPTDSLFSDLDDTIRDERLGMIRGIAETFAKAPSGSRYDMEMIIGAAAGAERTTVNRAGRFARALYKAGIPTGAVATGIERSDPAWVRLRFHTRSRKEARLRLDPSIAEAAQ